MKRRGAAVALGAILAVTAFVRFYRLDVTWFMLDQARDVTIASGIAHGDLTFLGPRIGWTDAYLGPLYYYLLSLPFLVTDAPIAGAVFVAAANVLAVFLLYRLVRRFWGEPAALAAAALFGAFPLAVWSSRLVWHAGLLPLFTVMFIRAVLAVAVEERSAATAPMLASLAVLVQLHLTTVAFVPLALLALAVSWRRLAGRHVLLGLALAALLSLPYLVHETTHGFENVRAVLAAAAGDGRAPVHAVGAVLLNVLRLYRPALAGFSRTLPPGFGVLYAVEAVLFAAGMSITAVRIVRRGRAGLAAGSAGRADLILLLWLALPLLLLGTRRTPMWWYYFDVLYPSQFLFAGITLAALPSLLSRDGTPRRMAAVVSIGLTAALVVSQTATLVAFQNAAARRGELVLDVTRFPINGAISPFGRLSSLPLGERSRLIRTLLEDFRVRPEDFARRVHGSVLGLPEENDYLVRTLGARVPPGPPGRGDTHYLIEWDRIVEYRPRIDVPRWSGRPLLRGTLRVPAAAPNRAIVVIVVAWAPTAAELRVDDVSVRPLGRTLRQEPLMIEDGSRWLMGVGWTTETVFAHGAAPGEHEATVRVEGEGSVIRVDVFERGMEP